MARTSESSTIGEGVRIVLGEHAQEHRGFEVAVVPDREAVLADDQEPAGRIEGCAARRFGAGGDESTEGRIELAVGREARRGDAERVDPETTAFPSASRFSVSTDAETPKPTVAMPASP